MQVLFYSLGIVQITDFLDFLNEYFEEKSETFTMTMTVTMNLFSTKLHIQRTENNNHVTYVQIIHDFVQSNKLTN